MMATVPQEFPAGSIHRSLGWQGQFARTSRWLDRLICARSADDAEDFLYAFFQNCYHLRDWVLVELTSLPVDRLFQQSLPLRICRDAANLTKHRILTRKPAQGHELSVMREYAGAAKGWFEPNTRLVLVTNYQSDGLGPV